MSPTRPTGAPGDRLTMARWSRRALSDPVTVTATAAVLLGVGWVAGAAVVVLVATGAGAGHSLSGSV